jgi:hypothetical protein
MARVPQYRHQQLPRRITQGIQSDLRVNPQVNSGPIVYYYLYPAYEARQIPWNTSNLDYANYVQPDYSLDQSVVNSTEADARLSDICAAAHAQGVVIYTVAFEAPAGGQSALQDCASSPSHYFDVNGTDISSAFSAIASDIRALKLTQ